MMHCSGGEFLALDGEMQRLLALVGECGAGHRLCAHGEYLWCKRCGLNASVSVKANGLGADCRRTVSRTQLPRYNHLVKGERPEAVSRGAGTPPLDGAPVDLGVSRGRLERPPAPPTPGPSSELPSLPAAGAHVDVLRSLETQGAVPA